MAVAIDFCFRVRLALSLSLGGSWPRWIKHRPHGFGWALAVKQPFCPPAQSVNDKRLTTKRLCITGGVMFPRCFLVLSIVF
jgi:hypothetical protein